MIEAKVKTPRKKAWRKLPCPACGKAGFLKDFINGFPRESMDEETHIYGGCLPEYWSPAEIACTDCAWEGGKDEIRLASEPPAMFSVRFHQAMEYANFWHASQVRTSTTIPYICHPLGVASLIIEAGGDEDLAIAGLLHDIPEDCGGEPRIVEIEEKFGSRVAEIVRACSDALPAEGEDKATWRERKEAHIKELHHAEGDVLIATAADKVHNARAIASDLQTFGTGVWKRFNAPREDILWYYDRVFDLLYVRNISPKLLVPLQVAIEEMKSERQIFRPFGDGSISKY